MALATIYCCYYECCCCYISALGQLLTRSWGTKLLADSRFFLMMVVIGLPEGLVPTESLPPSVDGEERVYAYKHAVMVQNALHHDFKIEVR